MAKLNYGVGVSNVFDVLEDENEERESVKPKTQRAPAKGPAQTAKKTKEERKDRKKVVFPIKVQDLQEVAQLLRALMKRKITGIKATGAKDLPQLAQEKEFMIENLELEEERKFPKEELEKVVGEPNKMKSVKELSNPLHQL